jgi:hypothetical protein
MKWRKSKVPADKQSIDQVKNFGIQFPSDFRRIAIASHGTQPSPDTIDFGDLKQILFGCLLSFEKNSPIYIERVYHWVKDDLPDKVFPFAREPFGNLYGFDYRDVMTLSLYIGTMNLQMSQKYVTIYQISRKCYTNPTSVKDTNSLFSGILGEQAVVFHYRLISTQEDE